MKGDALRTGENAVVIGAGIAGLTAALELVRSGRFRSVTVLESAGEVGGNIRSRPVEIDVKGEPRRRRWVDFGALQVWDWYRNFFELVRGLKILRTENGNEGEEEMDLKDLFRPIPVLSRFLEERRRDGSAPRRSEGTGRYVPFELSSLATEETIRKLSTLSEASLDLDDPEPSAAFPPTTSLRDVFPVESETGGRLASYFTSYTYGETSEIPAFRLIPMATTSNGREFSANGRMQEVPKAVARAVVSAGGNVRLNSPVWRVDVAHRIVQVGTHGATSDSLPYDVLIHAAPWGTIEFSSSSPDGGSPVVPPVRHVEVESAEPMYRYTHYASACVKFEKSFVFDPVAFPWSAGFAVPRRNVRYQVRAWGNLEALAETFSSTTTTTTSLPNRAIVYVYAQTVKDLWALDEATLRRLVAEVPFFRGNAPVAVDRMERFSHTMPVTNEAFSRALKRAQGQNGVWYAGHYLAAFPSVEGACRSGKVAALEALAATDRSTETLWDPTAFQPRLNRYLAESKSQRARASRKLRFQTKLARALPLLISLPVYLLLALLVLAVATLVFLYGKPCWSRIKKFQK